MKRSKLKKTSSQKKAIAKRAAWREVSKYVRATEPKCVTCGGPNDHAGHFIHNITNTKLYLDTSIIHSQCISCNLYLSGNLAKYTIFMIDTYGKEEVERLLDLKGSDELAGDKPNEKWYRSIEAKYKALNSET